MSSCRFNMLSDIEPDIGHVTGPSPVIPHVSRWSSSFVDIVKTSLHEIKREMKEIKKEMKDIVPEAKPKSTQVKLSWADMMEEEEEEECEIVSTC